MEWVERQVKERAAISSRATIIEKGISDIWVNLRAAVTDSVKAYEPEARREGWTFRSNGQEYATIVVHREIARANSGEPGGIVTATLDRNEPDITVRYVGKPSAPLLKFTFDVVDGAASLAYEGKPISTQVAAESILKPFLFPDLV